MLCCLYHVNADMLRHRHDLESHPTEDKIEVLSMLLEQHVVLQHQTQPLLDPHIPQSDM